MSYIGEIKLHAGTFAPRDWLFCQGQVLAIASYEALYSVIGDQFPGGDGTTTFALPDLRGRTPIGAGAGPGLTPRVQGQGGGTEAVSLLTNQMPSHDHVITNTPTVTNNLTATGSGTLKCSNQAGETSNPAGAFPAKTKAVGGDDIYTADASKATSTMDADALDISTALQGDIEVAVSSDCGNTGAGLAHENMQPWLCLNYIINFQPLYPPRNVSEDEAEK